MADTNVKYDPQKTVQKVIPPLFPFIFGEIISHAVPAINLETGIAIGTAIAGGFVGVVNWFKNRHKAA